MNYSPAMTVALGPQWSLASPSSAIHSKLLTHNYHLWASGFSGGLTQTLFPEYCESLVTMPFLGSSCCSRPFAG